MPEVYALSKISRFVILSCHHDMPRMEGKLRIWKWSSSLMCLLYNVQVSQPYRRIGRVTALCTFSLVESWMLCWFSTWDCSLPSAWHALQILALISLSREPSLDMILPRYLNSCTVFSAVPSMEMEGQQAADSGRGLEQDLCFANTDGEAKEAAAPTKLLITSCRAHSLCATMAQSSAKKSL